MDELIAQIAQEICRYDDAWQEHASHSVEHSRFSFEGMARAALAAIATHPRYELVELPAGPSEWKDGETHWNDYPYVALTEARVAQGGIIAVGPKCEVRYFLNPLEAKLMAANILAAVKLAEER